MVKVKITQKYGEQPLVTDLETNERIEGVYKYEINRSVNDIGTVILYLHGAYIELDIESDAEIIPNIPICPECQKAFTQTSKKQIYCEPKCANKAIQRKISMSKKPKGE